MHLPAWRRQGPLPRSVQGGAQGQAGPAEEACLQQRPTHCRDNCHRRRMSGCEEGGVPGHHPDRAAERVQATAGEALPVGDQEGGGGGRGEGVQEGCAEQVRRR